jgi:hypothetical protein
MIAIDVLKWPGVNQAFIVSFVAAVLMTLAVIPYGQRRKKGQTFTWGEAMLASTYAFGVLFLTYGVVPHQWIDHADKNLGWSKDKLMLGPGQILKPQSLGGWNPITLQYEALRDIIVVLIHAIFFGLNVFVVIWWQNRGKEVQKELPVSTYGRPLVKKA